MSDVPASILAAPDDDAPRLVYADQLQEAGDPLGELIVVQCELARRGAGVGRIFQDWIGDGLADDPKRVTVLRRREAALLRKHREEWVGDALDFTFGGRADVTLRRGFVEHVRWNANRQITKGLRPLLAVAPLLRGLSFGSDPPAAKLAAFFREKELHAIRELYVLSSEPLVDCRTLDHLERLDLNHPGGPHAVGEVVACLPALTALTLSSYKLAAATTRALPELVELQTISSRMGAEAADAIPTAKLEILSLRHANLQPGDVAHLARRWRGLRALDLRSNKLDKRDLAVVAALPKLRVLKTG